MSFILATCPAFEQTSGGKFQQVFYESNPATFEDAHLRCVQCGAILAEPKDYGENSNLRNYVDLKEGGILVIPPPINFYWIGVWTPDLSTTG